MSWLGDFSKFAQFNLADQWGKIKENPERPFIGAMDQGSTKVWNKVFDWTAPITGVKRNYEPMTDWFGGAPQNTYDKAKAQGINTQPFRTGQNVANTITAAYVGGYGAGQMGAGAGAGAGEGGAFVPTEGSSFIIDPSASYTTAYPAAGSGGAFTPTAGSNFAIDPNATYTPTYPNAGQAPYAGDQQYMNQDVMEQARNTSTTGQADSWNTPANNGGLNPLQKQLMAKSLMNMGGGGQYKQQPELEIIKGQPAFMQQPETLPIQDEPQKLAMALRNQNGY